MGIRIPAVLEAILEATAIETAAKARIAGLRKVLDTEARRRYAEEGAAPTWKARGAGAVRFDAPGDWAPVVADEATFGSYVAERHPAEVTAVIRLAATDLDDALTALGFVGIDSEATTEVRPGFVGKYLAGLVVDVEEHRDDDGSVDRTIRVIDPATGELVDGVSAQQANPTGKLVVTLDRDRRREVLEAAKVEAEALVAEATGQPAPAPVEPGRTVTLDELVANGTVRPASDLAPGAATPWDDEPHVYDPENPDGDSGHDRSCKRCGRHETEEGNGHIAAELTPTERATVDRFEAAPDALEEPATLVEDEDGAPLPAEYQTPAAPVEGHRRPYVGEGADGARRSAEIDRNEADTYDRDDERRDAALASAERWEAQAAELEAAATEPEEPARIPVDDRDHFTGKGPHGNATTMSLGEALAEQLTAYSREKLRKVARARGVNPGGTKPELIVRLVEAGLTIADVEAVA